MNGAYYNEIDPFAAEWLRRLIAAGHIAKGDVDERSIVEVRPDDLKGYRQCHFFAGIGGWSFALRLAGWPDDRPVWTGSCPCQPFSVAGAKHGIEDERHLWPEFFRLIRECRPPVVFGEQVAGPAGLAWLDIVCADLESEGYAVGAADLPACSVGAPHRRQRLWWVGDAQGERRNGRQDSARTDGGRSAEAAGILGDADSTRLEGRKQRSTAQRLADAGPDWRDDAGRSGEVLCAWRDLEWIPCTDGKARPVKLGIQPLAHGVPGRVGRLRAYGNAIVPQLAAEFILAYQETRNMSAMTRGR